MSNIYCCVNISLKCVKTRPSRRWLSSESAAYRRSAESISSSYTPVASRRPHLPVEAQRPSTSMGLHRTAFFSTSKVDDHWIMLWLCPTHGRSASLGVNGVGWPQRWASAWWFEGLRKTELPFDWQRKNIARALFSPQSHRRLIASWLQASRKANCKLFIDICLAKLLDNFHRTFHTLIDTIPCYSLT